MIRCAEARRAASIMIRSSIRWWFVGGQVDWMMKTSWPRMFSSIFTNVSPSGKLVTVASPSGIADRAADLLGQRPVGIAGEDLESGLAHERAILGEALAGGYPKMRDGPPIPPVWRSAS